MSACTFFGHRDCPSSIKPKLREVLIDLIENHAVDMFYVGQQGAFDGIVRSVLKELVSVYPHIRYAVVLERLPPKRDEFDTRDYSDTILPEGIEMVHPRFAISWRNIVGYLVHVTAATPSNYADLCDSSADTNLNHALHSPTWPIVRLGLYNYPI